MTITITNAKVVSDESSGLQNATATNGVAGDSDDNDILITSLPSVFSGSVFTGLTAVNAALSGYTGAVGNTGSNAFTVSPDGAGAITDVSFVGPTGQPLAGLDSGLLTVNGTKIFLYTDTTDNNIVLGRVGNNAGTPNNPGDDSANPSGTIAFAGYIQETVTGTAITGGKIWLVQYQTLLNPPINGINGPDDPVDLTGKVFIGVSQDANFSLAGAPSGQQLFLMFTAEGATPDATGRIPGVSIIVTGKDPLNQSASNLAITSADTVNSSQGGGNTTLGTNNQAITEQEGLRFSFVTGAKADVTIPNLSPGEAGVESNIDFTQYFGARAATFQIVQETGGTTAMIKLTAFTNAANVGGSQSGVNFIDSYANDGTEKVAITVGSVTVKTFAGVTIAASITYNADGTVLITGVPDNSQITYGTSTDHNRVLIENAASLTAKNGDKTHADFDIGGFKVLQTSVDQMEIGSHMVFEDDGPNIALLEQGGAGDATVDESSLGGAGATDSFDGSTFFNQTVATFGTDGSGATITQLYALKLATPLPSSGIVDTATGLTVQLKIDATNTVVTGYVVIGGNDTTVFTIGLDSATGTVTLTELRAVVHADTTNPNDQEKFDGSQILLTRTDTITDMDGDSVSSTKTADITAQFVFLDDGPSAGTNSAVQLDDDALANGIVGGTGDVSPDTANTIGTLNKSYGADGAGSVSLLDTGAPTGFSYVKVGDTLEISQTVGGVTTKVVTVALTNTSTGAYTVTQNAAVSHPAGNAENDLSFTINYRVTDKDGDHADSTLIVNVDDDTPTATGTAQTGTVDEDGLANGIAGGTGDVAGTATTATGSVAGIFQSGADTPLTYGLAADTSGVTPLSSGGTSLTYSVVGNTLTAKAGAVDVFTFAITDTASGAYTFTLLKPLDHAAGLDENDITINLGTVVQATDKDGDTVTASAEKVAILVDDDTPTLAFGNLVGTGTDAAQFGFWSKAAGADGPDANDLQISLSGFKLGGVAQAAANFSLTEAAASPDGSGNYNWSGSLKGDFDNNAATPDTTVTFTLSANPVTGKYALDLAAPITSTTTTDTATGGLGAGGPDAVQTLFIPPAPAIPKETVVFFSAKTSATLADISALIIPGATDPTEGSLEAGASASIDFARAMNVSTSGIGVANNVLEGDTNAAIGGAGSTDESFVVNPLGLVSTVRVFIDNSVSGYKFTPGPGSGGNERLYYTAYYSDGTNSGLTLVDHDISGTGTNNFFDVNGGTKLIDAVQLTMAKGDVKIPNIQFITVTESLAKDISLAFTASLTDKDGDTATSSFSADLFTNKAANATFDYELIGTALAADAFDVDLKSDRNDYQITGFDTTIGARDKIVLIGDTASVSISNGPGATDNSIVTITEATGGQTTTLTVIGVDLQAADLVFG